MRQILTLEERGYNAGSSPAYIGFGPIGAWQSNRNFYRCVFGAATTVRKFRVIASANPAAGTTITVTIMRSDVDTALAVTFTDSSALDLDTGATEEAFAVLDDIVIKGERTGAPGTPTFWISVEVETADGSSVVLVPMTTASVSPGDRRGALGDGNWTTNAASTIQDVIPCDGTIIASTALFQTSSGVTNKFETTLYLDGIAQNGAGGTVDTRCATSVGNFGKGVRDYTIPVVAGQLVHKEMVRLAGSGGLVAFTTGLVFVANTEGESIMAGRSSTPPTTNGSFYHQIGDDAANWAAFAGASRQKGVSSPFSIRKLHVRKEASPSPGAYAISVMRSDVASAVAVNVTAAGVVSNVVDSVTIGDGQTFMLENVSSGLPTGGNLMWSAVQLLEPLLNQPPMAEANSDQVFLPRRRPWRLWPSRASRPPFSAAIFPVPDILANLTYLPSYPDLTPHRMAHSHIPREQQGATVPPIDPSVIAPLAWLAILPAWRAPRSYPAVARPDLAPDLAVPPPGEQVVVAQALGWRPIWPEWSVAHFLHPWLPAAEGWSVDPSLLTIACVALGLETTATTGMITETLTAPALIDEGFGAPRLIDEEIC